MAVTSFSKKLASALAVAAVALGASIVSLDSATATTTNQTVELNNIDFERKGSIVVHKRLTANAGTTAANGAVNANPGGDPVANVQFSVQKLNYDLRSQSDWEDALAKATALKTQSATAAGVTAKLTGSATTQTTNAQGEATFSNLAVGVYLVKETSTAGATVNGQPKNIVVAHNDFIVFVPFTDPDTRNTWQYTVHVYPKNNELQVQKSIVDAKKNRAQEITYQVTTDIPTIAAPNTLSSYIVRDDLDQNKLELTEQQWNNIAVRLSDNSETLTKGTHYNVSSKTDDLLVTVTFTEQGLTILRAHTNARVITTIPATVKKAGKVANVADLFYNNPNMVSSSTPTGENTPPPPPPLRTNEVESYFANVKLVKKEAGTEKVLKDAQFEVYYSGDNNTCELGDLTEDNKVTAYQLSNNGTSTTGALTNTFTTDAKGEIFIEGLHAGDFSDNVAHADNAYVYCFKETVAPAGYVLPTGMNAVTTVTITKQDALNYDANVAQNASYAVAATVNNTRNSVPELPLTGGMGIALIIVIGGAIVAGGVVMARRNSREA